MNQKLGFCDFSTGSVGIQTRDLHRESWVSCHCTTYPTAVFQKLSPVKPIYYWGGRPLGTKPVFCDFPPLGVRSAKTQNVKKLRNFWEKLLRRIDFPPKSPPSSGKSRFPVFGPEFLEVLRAALGQKGLETLYFAISRLWVSVWPKRNVQKKLRHFGEELLGRQDFIPKSAPSSGK